MYFLVAAQNQYLLMYCVSRSPIIRNTKAKTSHSEVFQLGFLLKDPLRGPNADHLAQSLQIHDIWRDRIQRSLILVRPYRLARAVWTDFEVGSHPSLLLVPPALLREVR